MTHLSHSAPCGFKLRSRRSVVFFDKTMQHHDAAINNSAEENSRYAFGTYDPQLEKTISHSTAVRHSQIRAKSFHSVRELEVPGYHGLRQASDVFLYLIAEVFDGVWHEQTLTYLLTARNTPPILCGVSKHQMAGRISGGSVSRHLEVVAEGA